MEKMPIQLTIERNGNFTRLRGCGGARSVICGTQYDKDAHTLLFQRDAEYANDTLVLYFTSARVVLGEANEYTIPAALTQGTSQELEIAFIRNGTELEHSNTIALMFRGSIGKSETPPQPMPDTVLQLADQAMTSAEVSDEEIVFRNLQGDVRARIATGGGGPGGASQAYVDAQDAATLEAAKAYADTQPGPAGKDGQDGKDGLTTSVNNIVQIDGNIMLDANDVGAYSKEEVDGMVGTLNTALAARLAGVI